MKPSNSNSSHKSTNDSVSSMSQPQLVDLARCNHYRFWTSVTRKLKRYLTCCKLTEPGTKEKDKGKMRMDSCYLSEKKISRGDGGKLSKKNCNYYIEINEEERNEKLISAVRYCKDSKCRVSEHQSQFHNAVEISKYENLEALSCSWKGIGDTGFERQKIPCPSEKTMG